MEWNDKGIILGVKRHGETSAILEVMTRDHGRYMGLVRGGRSKRMRAVLQIGNSVDLTWRARLEEHLGAFQVEADTLRAANLMEQPLGIHSIQTLAAHLRLLPERESHPDIFKAINLTLGMIEDPIIVGRFLVMFELLLLKNLGFGLDLSECAASGVKENLIWVSPKSGRAVSRTAGIPYEKQLLALPDFLIDQTSNQSSTQTTTQTTTLSGDKKSQSLNLEQGFKLSFHFLERHCYIPRGIAPPQEREGLIKRILRAMV